MADRIQHRRDTAAGWTAANPTLLEGEIGIVLDSPSHYKVGDGLTAWNDLPLRGWDGALAQEPGNDAQTAMSQKAITEAIDAAEHRVEGKIGNLKEEITDNYAKQDGNYPKMSAGFAENIVGDKSATEEEFSFRPTAGVNRNTLNDGAARIHTLKGNSVVWNQKCKNTIIQSGSIVHTIVDGVDSWSGTSASTVTGILLDLTVGHKVLFLQNIIKNPNSISITFKGAGTGKEVFMTVTSQSTEVYWTLPQGVSVDGVVIYLKVIDLTQMFGAGNEPTTVEEFYQRMPIGVDINAYNAGKIVDGNYGTIKTTGFNQWDEQWEVGTINGGTGTNSASNADIRSSNYIPVLPATPYYFKCTSNITVVAYNANKEYIGYMMWGQKANLVETTPSNASYIRIATSGGTYGAAYKNDICISLYWPTEYGNLYGTYQAYKPFVRDLGDIIAKYFTDGIMRSAGSARDEIRFNSTSQKWEAIPKVGVVDLGSLTWTYSFGFFQTTEVNAASGYNLLCSKYQAGDGDKEIRGHSELSGHIIVRDSSFTDAATFKAAMQGVMLNYELAEPIVTPITENVNFDYDVSDYGTEELIVADGEQSAPVVADIEYSPNVLAVLKNAPDIANDVDALKSQVAALTEQLAALTTANTNE